MRLGAQFYSIRDRAATPEGIRESFATMKSIGYTIAQMSAIGPIEPERLRDISDEYDMPIVCTHTNPDLLFSDTEKIINEHKIYKCDTVGIGGMPVKYRGTLEGIRAFIEDYKEIAKKIEDAGLKFAYHNHAFEFDKLDGVLPFELLIEDFESLNFIVDVYWMKYAEVDYIEYIKRLGPKRTQNIHFKDMASYPKGAICPCGAGVIDFAPLYDLCCELNIPNALVEQDNAPSSNDSFGEMKKSFDHLAPIFNKKR